MAEAVTVVPPSMPVEPYLKVCDVILDLPLSNTTALFTAACACPGKPIISANVDDEFYGDHYRDYPGVDHVDSMPGRAALRDRIKAGTHQKRTPAPPVGEEITAVAHTNGAVRHLLQTGP